MIPTYREGRGRLWQLARVPAEATVLTMGAATAGWRRPPDFLVIGGRRCGSTTLYYGLLQHPAVLPLILSAGWLPLREHRKGTRWLDRPRPGGRWYRGHFPSDLTRRRTERRAGTAVTGEATPWYLAAPGAAARAAREAPDAKLVAVLRDPVARAHSQFLEQRRRGHEPLDDFAAALAAEDTRRRAGLLTPDGVRRSPAFADEHLTYRRQGEYARHLTVWLEHFPRSRLLVLDAAELFADTPAALGRVAGFLGLPEHRFVAEHRNGAGTAEAPTGLTPMVAAGLAEHFRPWNARLQALLDQTFTWA